MTTPNPTGSPPQYTLKNVLDINLTDDNIKILAQLFNTHCHLPNVEIEGKLGFLIEKTRDQSTPRFTLPGIRTIVPLDTDSVSYRKPAFNSQIDKNMWTHLKQRILGGKMQYEQHYKFPPHTSIRRHTTHTADTMYDRQGRGIRVSRDMATGKIVAVVEKKSLDHINYFNPTQPSCDFRISANEETQIPDFTPDLKSDRVRMVRIKDRTSFVFDMWSIDMTHVATYDERQIDPDTGKQLDTAVPTVSYEVEVECVDNAFVRQQAMLHHARQPNQMTQIAASLYDNLKTIAKFAFPTIPVPQTVTVPQSQPTQHAGVRRPAPDAASGNGEHKERKIDNG